MMVAAGRYHPHQYQNLHRRRDSMQLVKIYQYRAGDGRQRQGTAGDG